MRAAVFAYSRRGCETARRIAQVLKEAELCLFTPEKHLSEGFAPIGRPAEDFYGPLFRADDALIFVGACGIAVRHIAPFVRDKRTDPAVLCVDELGQFVIPLLSGHIGGANLLAEQLAAALGAVAVITTATDINRRFSVDAWATRYGLVIDDMKLAKAVSAAVLERDVPFYTPFPVAGDYPPGTVAGSEGELGISVDYRRKAPFAETLRLIPKVLHLGIGCRRGTPAEAITRAVEEVFAANALDVRAVRSAASVDLKSEEPGLLAFAAERGIPLHFYTAEELGAVPGEFTASDFVRSVAGVDNVCERAALLGADRLIVKKTALRGVTVAVAEENWEVRFG